MIQLPGLANKQIEGVARAKHSNDYYNKIKLNQCKGTMPIKFPNTQYSLMYNFKHSVLCSSLPDTPYACSNQQSRGLENHYSGGSRHLVAPPHTNSL